jgi:hypothetical protein
VPLEYVAVGAFDSPFGEGDGLAAITALYQSDDLAVPAVLVR